MTQPIGTGKRSSRHLSPNGNSVTDGTILGNRHFRADIFCDQHADSPTSCPYGHRAASFSAVNTP
jgi:hypothetical protein